MGYTNRERPTKAFGKRIAGYRRKLPRPDGRKADFTREQLVDKAGEMGLAVTTDWLYGIEQGYKAEVTISDALALSRVLERPLHEILCDVTQPFGPADFPLFRGLNNLEAIEWVGHLDYEHGGYERYGIVMLTAKVATVQLTEHADLVQDIIDDLEWLNAHPSEQDGEGSVITTPIADGDELSQEDREHIVEFGRHYTRLLDRLGRLSKHTSLEELEGMHNIFAENHVRIPQAGPISYLAGYRYQKLRSDLIYYTSGIWRKASAD
ncbi:MAG: hypothetical protein KH329_01450 [Bifidobacterium longum]|nr:hypothetical protein [Bifidobacterium longum]MBS6514888.1 hypothetical protein [Bifidobacterium longum]MDU2402173.1 hypothetical protein [Bifidobacterium longum]MDU3566145.1 hypothetical protein [Bifidobacterium longum]MDU6623582.1 hypothetical protein [Bifidobacterium longum]